MSNVKAAARQYSKEIVLDVLASLFGAIYIASFVAPNHIAQGGVTGIAVVLNYSLGLPVGMMSLVINVPIMILAYLMLGRDMLVQTLRTLLIYTVMVDGLFSRLPAYTGDPLLAALFGGVFSGLSAGIIFSHGSTSGGTDIVTKLVQKKYPHLSVGQLVVVINAAVMLMAALVYQSIEAALYGLVMTFTAGRVMDAILYGADTGKYAMIVTGRPQELSEQIIAQLRRGATILKGTGAYKMEDRSMLMCVVRKPELFKLKKVIREVDPDAFVIISDAAQILGRGFKSIDASDT